MSLGLSALARLQSEDGSFPLFRRAGSSDWHRCGSLFSTAYVMLGAGRLLPAENAARAAAFILGQRRPDGLWEYDPALGIPPDADSTACALAALALHGISAPRAGGADLLRSFWRQGDGPFRTWRVEGKWSLAERDEAVVNCNILFALRLIGSPATPPEAAAVIDLLRRTPGPPRYYCAAATMAHAARRAGLGWDQLPEVATARPPAGDLIASVQWLCASPAADAELIDAVLAAQRPDGRWPITPWVTGVGTPQPFWGGPAITTALALEALGACPSNVFLLDGRIGS
jgi:hypothetical protein